MKKHVAAAVVIAAAMGLAGCPPTYPPVDSSTEMLVPYGFAYEMDDVVRVEISVNNVSGTPAKGAVVRVYDDETAVPNPTGLIVESETNEAGQCVTDITLPERVSVVTVSVGVLGIPNITQVDVEEGAIRAIFPNEEVAQ